MAATCGNGYVFDKLLKKKKIWAYTADNLGNCAKNCDKIANCDKRSEQSGQRLFTCLILYKTVRFGLYGLPLIALSSVLQINVQIALSCVVF